MHTPSSYMYSDLRSFGGITNKEAASELLTDQTPCGNGAPRDRINERTFLSRQIVHATPSQVHPEYYGDFHQSAQTITSKIASNLAMPCAYHEVIKHYGGQAAKEMGALLRHYSLDGNLYANAIRRINASPMPESSDKAVLLVMMFLITGCLADPEIAAKTTRSFMAKKLSFTFSTLQPELAHPDHVTKCSDKPTKLGLIRIDNDVACSPIYPLSTSKEGTIIGLLATGTQNINDVDIDVSRKHLRIFENESTWYAQGLGSTNGTTLISGDDKSITVIESQGSANKQYPPRQNRPWRHALPRQNNEISRSENRWLKTTENVSPLSCCATFAAHQIAVLFNRTVRMKGQFWNQLTHASGSIAKLSNEHLFSLWTPLRPLL